MPPKLHLRFKGITAKTARAYRNEINGFFAYLEAEDESIPAEAETLDFLVSEYINYLYQNGDSLTQAGWLLSGMKRFVPSLRFKLPTSQQLYQNWVRDHVPQRAVPMPWSSLGAIASLAWQSNQRALSILLLLGFTFFVRSMEFITLQKEDLVLDSAQGHLVVTLRKTKTSRQFQQSLVLRHPGLLRIVVAALPHLPATGPLWRGSAASFRKCFTALLCYFDLEPYGFSLYSLRRGGAAHIYTRARDLNYVAMQGRWKAFRTARIYLDDARATLLKLSYPRPITRHLATYAAFWSSFR